MVSTEVDELVLYQHLAKITPEIAEEFRSRHKCDPSQANIFSLEDLISSYNNTIFANSLVFKHLCKVSPNLAKYFMLHSTACEDSLDDLVVLYEKINDTGKMRRTKLKVDKAESEGVFEGECSDTELFMEELEKYNPCFASSESESEIEDDIYVLSEDEKSSKINRTKNSDAPTNKLITDFSEEDINGFCHILDCEVYLDLQQSLGNKTCLDKLASHILNKNIIVRKIHQKLTITHFRLDNYISREILTNGTIKFGFFNLQENSLMETNWHNLLEETNLSESTEEVLDIFRPSSSKKTKADALKCNVVGLYLSLGMVKVRYTSDVFEHAKTVLAAKSRRLSPEEKDFLVEYVDKRGENCDWKELGYILYKKHVKNGVTILKHIYAAKKNSGKRGQFKIEEDKIILDFMFSENRNRTVISASFKEPEDWLKILSRKLDRSEMSIYFHWNSLLKTQLLQHHAGTLNLDIKRVFLNYLNDKEVIYLQDIQWSELLSQPQFAGHTRLSLTTEFNSVRSSVSRVDKCNNREVRVP